MALSAAIVLEVRNGGSDTNGGGFKTGATGTDWTLQNAAQYAVADGVTAGTTTITSATAAFGTDVVGNLIYVTGGTGSVTAGWYEITARTNSTTITVDRSTGLTAGTGVTLNIGGALASPGQAGAIATVAGQITFIKYNASPYVATSASTNIAAGCVLGTSTTYYCGYDTTRTLANTDANRPTFQINSGVSAATLFTGTNNQYWLMNIILDGNAQTTSRCMFQSGYCYRVKGTNAVSGLVQNSGTLVIIACEISVISGASVVVALLAEGCVAHGNTDVTTSTGSFNCNSIDCISYANSHHGFISNNFTRCSSYGNTQSGFTAWNGTAVCVDCISEGNATFGYHGNGGNAFLINSASYNNTSGRSNGQVKLDLNAITGSGSFFTNAAGQDFTLNNTAGAGALARAATKLTPLPIGGTTISYADIGAAQHQDAGGGGGGLLVNPGMRGGMV